MVINKDNYPETVEEFINACSFDAVKARDIALHSNGILPPSGTVMCVEDVYTMISHYFNTKPKSEDLSAEDFAKAININLDALIASAKEKEGTANAMAAMMLEYTKNFINEFVETAVVKTEDEDDSPNDNEDVFAAGGIIIANLPDTVPFMLHTDYRYRFKAEYYQLKIRFEKLVAMLDKWDKDELSFTPDCPRSIYDLQVRAMKDYLAVLEARAKIEGIEL